MSLSPSRLSAAPSPLSRRNPVRLAALGAATLLAGAGLTACSSSDDSSDPHRPAVVASTNVYGDIARVVAGDAADVRAVISDPKADPHSFEATPADAAAITTADLVVYNGAGYDSFVDSALANAEGTPVVRAVDVFQRETGTTVEAHEHGHAEAQDEHSHDGESNDEHAHDDKNSAKTTDNEHVWFSLPTAAGVATDVAEKLAALDPADAESFRANARSFGEKLRPLHDSVTALGKHHRHYVATEPIGDHLFDEADFHDVTPAGFTSAIEEGQDPSAADVTATRDLVTGKKIDFLAFNTQTETGTTSRLRDSATRVGVPVVSLTETLPDGMTYVSWMTAQVDALRKAVGG